MESTDVKADFVGFGPITQSKATHIGGFGRAGSFAPTRPNRVRLRSDRNIYQPIGEQEQAVYPFQLRVVTVAVGGTDVSKIRVQYGEIDGVPPNGLTLNDDYLLEPGNSFIYLIVTFDGDGRISSRTIGFDNPVPDDTNDTKHIILGEVSYAGGLYEIVNQNIAQDIYPEKALVVDRSDDSFVYSLFADPRKINAIYELENFNVNLDGDNSTTTLYLKSQDNAEYLELKKDSDQGECSVYGYAGNNAQNFILSSSDASSISKLELFDSGSANYIETKVDTDETEASVYGYAGNNAQNFILSSNDASSISKLELFDTANANFFTTRVDSTSKVSARGYSNNEEQNFLIEADSTAGNSKVRLFDSGSANYIETKVDTDETKASVYGYTSNGAQNFIISSDASGADVSKVALFDTDSQNYIELKEASDVASVYGYMNNQEHSFDLKAQAGQSRLELFNQDSECFITVKATNTESTVYGYVDNESEYFFIKAKSEDTQIYLFGDGHYVKIDIPDNNGTTLDAEWQEIDICVDGVAKKMKVLGTEPY